MSKSAAKRLYDIFFAGVGLFFLSPLLLLLSLAVKLSDGGPVFFRQKRVGQHGKIFWIWKFRTMRPDAEQLGPSITRAGDSRVTLLGKLLRKTKLDELPQLWNVLRGEMSLVGPRPEVPHYVERYSAAQKQILALKPGITDLATLKFRNEEQLLQSAKDVEAFYLQYCVPRKLDLNLRYANQANLWKDTQLIFQTLFLAAEANAILRYLMVILTYSAALIVSLWVAYELRFDFSLPPLEIKLLSRHLGWILPLKLVILLLVGQSAGLLSFFTFRDFRRMVAGLALATTILFAVWYLTGGSAAPPRGVLLPDFIFSCACLAGLRLFFRLLRESYLSNVSGKHPDGRRIGIIGAGYAGTALARELSIKRGLGPVAFFDDDPEKWGAHIHDIPIVGAPEVLSANQNGHQVDEVIIAMPSAGGKRLQEIVQILHRAALPFQTVPSLDELSGGGAQVTHLRRVKIEDLLDGEPINLDLHKICNLLLGKTVLVTGAGGSIGTELSRQILRYGPKKLLALDRSESHLFILQEHLHSLGYGDSVDPLVADVLDAPQLARLLTLHRPEVIFHTAGHNQVPLMEQQPTEAIKNNLFGTVQLAELAAELRVERFIHISSDRACLPDDVLSSAKRVAETFLHGMAESPGCATHFISIRCGDLLTSPGNLVPTCVRQIAAGGPVRLGHPEAICCFLTVPEAVSLILQGAAQAQSGGTFQLDPGKPFKVVDVVTQLIELGGMRPTIDIPIEFEPGISVGNGAAHPAEPSRLDRTGHPKIFLVPTPSCSLTEVKESLATLKNSLYAPPDELKQLLRTILTKLGLTAEALSAENGEVNLDGAPSRSRELTA